jgi:hypothetical protein
VSVEEPKSGARERSFDRRTVIPLVAILVLGVVLAVALSVSSGGSSDKLRIDQGVSAAGSPEIVVNVPVGVNTPAEASNSTNVVLICVDAGGKTVLETNQVWPFVNEPGYPDPHIHQPVTPEQLQRIAKCRLRGTKTKLEGHLRRS